MEPEVRETIDYIAVRRLQDAYADVVNRRAWPELHEIFRPDCEVVLDTRAGELRTVNGPAGLGEFLDQAMARFGFFLFVVLGTRIVLAPDDPDRATARLYMCEHRTGAHDGRRSIAFGVYHDDYLRIDNQWWFAHRKYHSLARTPPDVGTVPTPDLAVFPFPDVTLGPT